MPDPNETMNEPTPLDLLRSEYVKQIMKHAREPVLKDGLYMIDSLLMEWGAKAYRQGRADMAERLKKCADDWVDASS